MPVGADSGSTRLSESISCVRSCGDMGLGIEEWGEGAARTFLLVLGLVGRVGRVGALEVGVSDMFIKWERKQ